VRLEADEGVTTFLNAATLTDAVGRRRRWLGSEVVPKEVRQHLGASNERLDIEPWQAGDGVDPQFSSRLVDDLRVGWVAEVSPAILDRPA
jgi:hypothetical protein